MCPGQGLLQEAHEHLGLQEASLPPEEAHTPCTMSNPSGSFASRIIYICYRNIHSTVTVKPEMPGNRQQKHLYIEVF